MLEPLSDHLYRHVSTCNVYVLTDGDRAVLIDAGDASVLDELDSIGVRHVTDVLLTHHHRDQAQGLPRLHAAGARIWVPHAEQELIAETERRWLARDVANNYNTRQDRFSPATSVPIAGTLREEVSTAYGHVVATAIPLPGHTVGSVGLLVDIDGRRVAFTGDLLAGEGKVWSLAATQWSYAGGEGLALSWCSLQDLRAREPRWLLPSHGPVLDDPPAAIDTTADRLRALLDLRGEHHHLADRWTEPWREVTPHLLHNRSSHSHSYALLSGRGTALLIDFGYDFEAGLPAGTDRAARRTWLPTLRVLAERHGVERVDVVIPTHYHDDHVAGFNLLREVYGTQVWSAEIVATVIEDPAAHDLPCLWHDPIAVDRVLPLGEPIRWEGHELVLHPFPGHTLHQVAIELEVDGVHVVATGDQVDGDGRCNYVYQNRFRVEDYRVTGELLRRLAPDLLLTGHWGPLVADDGLLELINARGVELERLHRDLLPLEECDLGAEGVAAWLRPYRAHVRGGEAIQYEVELRNPAPQREAVEVALVVPNGWEVQPAHATIELDPGEHGTVSLQVRPPAGLSATRIVIVADVRVGERRLGHHAEALVSVG